MKNVKNIIFDLGGVVIDLDRHKAVEALDRLGIPDSSSLLGEYEQKGPFLALEKGEISSSELYDMLMPYCKEGTRCSDIQDAFEEFLRQIPLERLKMLEKLRSKGYRLFVLSNTNPIMYNHWIDNAFRQDGKSINDYFEGIVTSYQERMCKPDPALFQKVVDRYGLDPSETLMLDDSAANVDSARGIGLQALQITDSPGHSFMEVCNQLISDD